MNPLTNDELRFRKQGRTDYHPAIHASISNDENEEVEKKKGQLGANSVKKLSTASSLNIPLSVSISPPVSSMETGEGLPTSEKFGDAARINGYAFSCDVPGPSPFFDKVFDEKLDSTYDFRIRFDIARSHIETARNEIRFKVLNRLKSDLAPESSNDQIMSAADFAKKIKKTEDKLAFDELDIAKDELEKIESEWQQRVETEWSFCHPFPLNTRSTAALQIAGLSGRDECEALSLEALSPDVQRHERDASVMEPESGIQWEGMQQECLWLCNALRNERETLKHVFSTHGHMQRWVDTRFGAFSALAFAALDNYSPDFADIREESFDNHGRRYINNDLKRAISNLNNARSAVRIFSIMHETLEKHVAELVSKATKTEELISRTTNGINNPDTSYDKIHTARLTADFVLSQIEAANCDLAKAQKDKLNAEAKLDYYDYIRFEQLRQQTETSREDRTISRRSAGFPVSSNRASFEATRCHSQERICSNRFDSLPKSFLNLDFQSLFPMAPDASSDRMTSGGKEADVTTSIPEQS